MIWVSYHWPVSWTDRDVWVCTCGCTHTYLQSKCKRVFAFIPRVCVCIWVCVSMCICMCVWCSEMARTAEEIRSTEGALSQGWIRVRPLLSRPPTPARERNNERDRERFQREGSSFLTPAVNIANPHKRLTSLACSGLEDQICHC